MILLLAVLSRGSRCGRPHQQGAARAHASASRPRVADARCRSAASAAVAAGVRLARGDTVQLDGADFDWERQRPTTTRATHARRVYAQFSQQAEGERRRARRTSACAATSSRASACCRRTRTGSRWAGSTRTRRARMKLTSDGGIVHRLLRPAPVVARSGTPSTWRRAPPRSSAACARARDHQRRAARRRRSRLTAPPPPWPSTTAGAGCAGLEISEARAAAGGWSRPSASARSAGSTASPSPAWGSTLRVRGGAFLSEGQRSALGLPPGG